MDKKLEKLFQVLERSMQSDLSDPIVFDGEQEFLEIYQLACKNALMGISYRGIYDMESDEFGNHLNGWKLAVEQSALMSVRHLYDLKKIYQLLEKEEIHPIVFKGISLASLYVEPFLRQSSDDDILIPQKDMEKAKDVILQEGYQLIMEDTKEKVWVYYNYGTSHKIEVHCCLWEDFEGEQMELLERMYLDKEDTLLRQSFRDFSFYTLGYTEHLIYQMFHIVKHFTVEGIGLKYFPDIKCYVDQYYDVVDWKRFWKSMEQMGYTKFAKIFFTVCMQYLGMKKTNEAESEEDCQVMVEDMAYYTSSGNFQIIATMSPYLEGRASVSSSKGKRIMKMLFPMPNALQEDFWYAKKCVILLPIAWVHKWFRFLLNRIVRKKGVSASEKMKLAEHRMAMLDKMELLGKGNE